ncbi:DUF2264 domain-containing protein [Termitidicoccus mucosus]
MPSSHPSSAGRPEPSATFQIKAPDFALSPFTGMARRHWVEAGQWLLDGVFSHVENQDAPLLLPRSETKITYPQPGDPDWRRRSEIMEGVARTLLIAGPLLRHDPSLRSNGIALRDYYANAILKLADPKSPDYVGDQAGMVKVWGDRPIQVTCECASLALELTLARDSLWANYTRAEKDMVARLFHTWGHCRTHAHNWRLFNMHILSFLQREGYEIDGEILREHLRVVRAFDAGDGWYRDGTYFDYYSVWAFQFYAPLWAAWGGCETHPAIADAIERGTHALLKTYDRLFDRDGWQPMWGRSGIYRFAASAPFASAFFLKNAGVNPGLARRVLSGNLFQFISHPDFANNGVPTLGFYGQFPPMVQPYSCAASPFWFGNAYQGVALPETHPLWTAREEAGSWEGLAAGAVRETELPGPGLVLTQYGGSGAAEMRTGKVMIVGGHKVLHNYSHLAFHTRFPWQSDTADGLMSMHYNVRGGAASHVTSTGQVVTAAAPADGGAVVRAPNLLLYSGVRGGVCYRRLLFDFAGALGDNPAVDLADFAVPCGLVRCDRLRIHDPGSEIILCHHALPVAEGADLRIEEREVGPLRSKALLLASGERQLALVNVHGWDSFIMRREAGLHPEARESILPGLTSRREARYKGDPWRITLMLHRCDAKPWRDDELWPFRSMLRHDEFAGDASAIDEDGRRIAVDFALNDGSVRRVSFDGMEGTLRV